MKTYKYTGLFRTHEGMAFYLEVHTNSFRTAYYLLIAQAINSGRSYNLVTITSEEGRVRHTNDIETLEIFN